jgi:hypothetical protein
VAIVLNVVLSIATIGLVFVLARRLAGTRVGLGGRRAVGRLAQPHLPHRRRPHRDAVPVPVRAAAVVALGDPGSAASPGQGRLVTWGLLFGACILVRRSRSWPPPVFLILWWDGLRRRGLAAGAGGRGHRAVLVPWAVRSSLAWTPRSPCR